MRDWSGSAGGLRGGKAGAAAVVTLATPDGVTRHLPSKGAFAAPAEIHGRALILTAYAEAVREHYRFFSYGDAMLIL